MALLEMDGHTKPTYNASNRRIPRQMTTSQHTPLYNPLRRILHLLVRRRVIEGPVPGIAEINSALPISRKIPTGQRLVKGASTPFSECAKGGAGGETLQGIDAARAREVGAVTTAVAVYDAWADSEIIAQKWYRAFVQW